MDWWGESCVCSRFGRTGQGLGWAAGAVAVGVRTGRGGCAKASPELTAAGEGSWGAEGGWDGGAARAWLAAFPLPAGARSPRGHDAGRGAHGSQRSQDVRHKFIPPASPAPPVLEVCGLARLGGIQRPPEPHFANRRLLCPPRSPCCSLPPAAAADGEGNHSCRMSGAAVPCHHLSYTFFFFPVLARAPTPMIVAGRTP